MYRFIHTSDWHLGKPFGQFDDDLRGRLREARHSIIDRIATNANQAEASLIVVAGDVWDNPTPSPAVLQQSLDAMARHAEMTWALMPGNHDLAREGGLWERIAARCPENVLLLVTEEPIEVNSGIFLLPAPCRTKDPGRDLTEWMDDADTPHGGIRIGVAHGGIREFGAERPHSSVIDPNRASHAKLDYLALGDWHGTLKINDRCWYSGTPEPDRFKKNESGNSLLVSIAGSGQAPSVKPFQTSKFTWIDQDLDLLPQTSPTEFLGNCLPESLDPRNTLVDLRLKGRGTMADRAILNRALEELGPSFAFFSYNESELETIYEAEDLDEIDRAGALREAAEALKAEATDSAIRAEEREIAHDALNLLYSWCRDAETQS